MMDNIKNIISSRDMVVPSFLFYNYKKLGLSMDELFLMIYIINSKKEFNPKKFSDDLSLELTHVMELMDELVNKGFIKLSIVKSGGFRKELIDINGFYDKALFLLTTEEKKESSNNIYDIFVSEFGRDLSPMEREIINAWINDNVGEDVIIGALKEATYNGFSNLRYIDKLISEWGKKNNSKVTIPDVKSKETVHEDVFDYDWLNDSNE